MNVLPASKLTHHAIWTVSLTDNLPQTGKFPSKQVRCSQELSKHKSPGGEKADKESTEEALGGFRHMWIPSVACDSLTSPGNHYQTQCHPREHLLSPFSLVQAKLILCLCGRYVPGIVTKPTPSSIEWSWYPIKTISALMWGSCPALPIL